MDLAHKAGRQVKMKFFSILLLVLFILPIFATSRVFAESSYVLPYPSYMPGNAFYTPRLILNKLTSCLYFGDFGKFTHSLTESDNYLVEAKTLFEYKQYLLAMSSLKKSDFYFKKTKPNLDKAKNNGKNITDKQKVLREASGKHIEVLTKLKTELPKSFVWNPEKSESINLEIEKALEDSIKLRSSNL